MNLRFLLLFIVQITCSQSQDCNICGEGNSFYQPTGVVEFEYKNQTWKDSCKELQETVKNPVAISDDFCRNEMLQYTKEPCLCATPDGVFLIDLETDAPTPSSVFVGNPAPTKGSDKVSGTNTTEILKCQQDTNSGKGCTDEGEDTPSSNAEAIRTALWCLLPLASFTFYL